MVKEQIVICGMSRAFYRVRGVKAADVPDQVRNNKHAAARENFSVKMLQHCGGSFAEILGCNDVRKGGELMSVYMLFIDENVNVLLGRLAYSEKTDFCKTFSALGARD
ncbi:unnamed protein product [Eruca vesicaria subsp. sativa]|uniref:Uncharacterized protein n=1 Tax=Eruca vesicaria subsp. sativa TaxID=29727 RepID=A0ABC8JPK8_ERUVS|nr:unnamed protein product [Eruca vesicaria subsp. sativa]